MPNKPELHFDRSEGETRDGMVDLGLTEVFMARQDMKREEKSPRLHGRPPTHATAEFYQAVKAVVGEEKWALLEKF